LEVILTYSGSGFDSCKSLPYRKGKKPAHRRKAMEQNKPAKGLSGLQVTGIVAGAMVLTMVATLFIVKTWLFPSPFDPVVLSPSETQQLERKLSQFDQMGGRSYRAAPGRQKEVPTPEDLKPEPYSEKGASREIRLSERVEWWCISPMTWSASNC
jgi:hypothetical protein